MQIVMGDALGGVKDNRVEADTVVQNVQKIGETLKHANTLVEPGSSLWLGVQKLAPLPDHVFVGGARIIAGWLGMPF